MAAVCKRPISRQLSVRQRLLHVAGVMRCTRRTIEGNSECQGVQRDSTLSKHQQALNTVVAASRKLGGVPVPFHCRIRNVDFPAERFDQQRLEHPCEHVVRTCKVGDTDEVGMLTRSFDDLVLVEILIEWWHTDVWQSPFTSEGVQSLPPLEHCFG